MSVRERSGSWFQKAVSKISPKPKQKVKLPEGSIEEEAETGDGGFQVNDHSEDAALHENHQARKVSKSSTKFKARRVRDNQKVFVQFSFDGINILERKTRVVLERFMYAKVRSFRVNTFEGLFEFECLNSGGDVSVMSFSCNYPTEMQKAALDYAHAIAHKQRSNTISESRQSRSFTTTSSTDDPSTPDSKAGSTPSSPARQQRAHTEYSPSPPPPRDSSPPKRRGSIFDKPPVKPIEEPTKFLISDLNKDIEELDLGQQDNVDELHASSPQPDVDPTTVDAAGSNVVEDRSEGGDTISQTEQDSYPNGNLDDFQDDAMIQSDNDERGHEDKKRTSQKKPSSRHSRLSHSHSSSSSSISTEVESPSQKADTRGHIDFSSKKGDFLDL
eukprot:TRINITY_DN12731_c0_g1_i1.p1 TRINITY_DN12731_c0_g1~~TRINITY_DN12731_c0_g1_i1.p1  ORF type:complete len:387 (+),score=81.02 TRINITY_DN12731_c0_g1_i1:52-1212(+)